MKRLYHISILLLFSLVLFIGLVLSNAPDETSNNRMVIVTHLHEITQNRCYVGDVVKFRIHYYNDKENAVDIGILDKLDPKLSQISVSDNGQYNQSEHKVIWLLENVNPDEDGFVEITAKIEQTDTIKNKAYIGFEGLSNLDPSNIGQNLIETNEVEITINEKPQMGWIKFDDSLEPQKPAQSYMKDETSMGMLVNFDIPGMYVHEVKVDGVTYHRLSIPRGGTLGEVGKPELPIAGQVVEIPYGTNISVEIIKSKSKVLENYKIYPKQKPEIRGNGDNNEFIIDRELYETNTFFPVELSKATRNDIGVIRGHRIAFIKVRPVQFNPVTNELRVFSNLEVRLKYDKPAQIKPVDFRVKSKPYEELLSKLVLNFKYDGRFARPKQLGSVQIFQGFGYADYGFYDFGPIHGFDKIESTTDSSRESSREPGQSGCDYLIITDGTFYNATDPNNPVVQFRNWKQQKGLITEVIEIANIPDDPAKDQNEDIQDYIQDAYDNWARVPTYILLVGDTEFIPTNYVTPHPNHINTGTDLYYVTVDDDGTHDYFPDIFIGRLSVDTQLEAQDVINKIIDYEQTPPLNANFYSDTSLVCLFEDDTDPWPGGDPWPEDGQEDGGFRITEFAEEARNFLQNNGYNAQRIYATSSGFSPADTGSAIPQRYENGSLISATSPALQSAVGAGGNIVGFPWDGATGDITTAITNGNFLVTYNGHGSRDRWGLPQFTNANVNGLANGRMTPVVLSFSCQNGWFDHETDNDATTTTECFCENFLRNDTGGAVAIIGSTRISWDNNDFMMLGAYEAIWPNFTPNPPFTGPGGINVLPGVESGPLLRMGQINTFAKTYMSRVYGHNNHRLLTYEMYTLFGDPEMPIFTELPGALNIEHPQGIGATGSQDFIVKVNDNNSGDPILNAVVALTRNDSIIAVQYTNAGGIARFTLFNIGDGDIEITVTAINYRFYQGTIEVNAGGAILNRLDPPDGPVNQVINVGGINFQGNEIIDISFDGQPIPPINASQQGDFGQGIPTVDITVPANHPLGPVNVLAHGRTSDCYAIDVFYVRTANPIDLYMYDQWDTSTWHLHTGDNPTWNNPDIQLYDEDGNSVSSNDLEVGRQYTIRSKVHNDTNFAATNVSVTIKAANFGLGQPDNVWNVIGQDTIAVPANDVREAEVQWVPPSTGHLCIVGEIYHIEDINGDNNRGQENTDVGAANSPVEIPFEIWNMSDEPAALHLELRQIVRHQLDSQQKIWGNWLKHPDPQIIPPGGKSEGKIVIDPDYGNINEGEQAEFALTGYIGKKMVGGVNVILTRERKKGIFSIHGGLSFPLSNLSNNYKMGFNIQGDLEYIISNNLSTRALVGYSRFPAKIAGMDDFKIINTNLLVRYYWIFKAFKPFLEAGPGYYRLNNSVNKMGSSIGAGIRFDLNPKIALELGGNYHRINTNPDTQYINLGGGLILKF